VLREVFLQNSRQEMNKNKNVHPIRTCIVCRRRFVKDLLDRYVWEHESGKVVLDILQNMSGRGAYCCGDETCKHCFINRKQGWKRAFRLN
jgi:hypothetical protein